jgi:hypothetical protein
VSFSFSFSPRAKLISALYNDKAGDAAQVLNQSSARARKPYTRQLQENATEEEAQKFRTFIAGLEAARGSASLMSRTKEYGAITAQISRAKAKLRKWEKARQQKLLAESEQ